jgi:serine/threonine protein kinase
MLEPGTVLQNRYAVASVLARSAEHIVYLAHDQRLSKDVEIKETFFQAASFVKQFEFEAQLLARLKHSALPVVSDYFIEPAGQYLVLEHIPGVNLSTYLAVQPEQRLGERAMRLFIAPLLDALEYLHTFDPPIIHRNVHPDNVLLGNNGKVYLTNFSTAKAYTPNEQTSIGAESVTRGFSPIEQYGGGSTDARSDLYALRATIYVMLSGQTPPPALKRMPVDKLAPLPTLNPDVSQPVWGIVSRLMAPQPEDRYQDIASLRRDLNM